MTIKTGFHQHFLSPFSQSRETSRARTMVQGSWSAACGSGTSMGSFRGRPGDLPIPIILPKGPYISYIRGLFWRKNIQIVLRHLIDLQQNVVWSRKPSTSTASVVESTLHMLRAAVTVAACVWKWGISPTWAVNTGNTIINQWISFFLLHFLGGISECEQQWIEVEIWLMTVSSRLAQSQQMASLRQ